MNLMALSNNVKSDLSGLFFCMALGTLSWTNFFFPDFVFAADKIVSWEEQVKVGNDYSERGRYAAARKAYQVALKILEKQDCADLRKAIILHDIAKTYRAELKYVEARLNEIEAHAIYKREIRRRQLGREYASKKPVENFSSGSLRPVCYLCHENWKVVPIRYGHEDGYNGEAPDESDPDFTHKPGGALHGDQRWYCRDCKQAF